MPESKNFLSREAILGAEDMDYEDVYISTRGWEGYIRVKSLSAAERDKFENSITEREGIGRNVKIKTKDNIRARLVALSVVDPESNKRMFSEGDVNALGQKSAQALDKIFEAASRLSGISEQDIDELEKKSKEGGPDSPSN